MPLDFHKSSKEFQLGIWRMDESLEELHRAIHLPVEDQMTMDSFKSQYRKHEWLTTRVLVKQLLSSSTDVNITYDASGKPRLVNSRYSISISHTQNFVAVLLSENRNPGIDIETIRPERIDKIAKRFINEKEAGFIEVEKKPFYQHVIWGTKEVLFKIYASGELNFLEHLHVNKFKWNDTGELTGEIIKKDFKKEYKVSYEKINDLMLVYAMDD